MRGTACGKIIVEVWEESYWPSQPLKPCFYTPVSTSRCTLVLNDRHFHPARKYIPTYQRTTLRGGLSMYVCTYIISIYDTYMHLYVCRYMYLSHPFCGGKRCGFVWFPLSIIGSESISHYLDLLFEFFGFVERIHNTPFQITGYINAPYM
jgi:hypothetical protein